MPWMVAAAAIAKYEYDYWNIEVPNEYLMYASDCKIEGKTIPTYGQYVTATRIHREITSRIRRRKRELDINYDIKCANEDREELKVFTASERKRGKFNIALCYVLDYAIKTIEKN